ncbi:hypothetical protein KAT60_01195 [Candidatus Woesebacteria bacterium]|nr:hypothetical protein [Candidatus Woesebacteria bacterium]
MFKRMFVLVLMMVLLLVPTGVAFADGPPDDSGPPPDCGQGNAGFDEYGYNYCADIFVGDADGIDCNLDGTVWGDDTYAGDLIVMKWSQGWDNSRFHGQPWGHDAWLNNNWNGKKPGGSGENWHYKIDYSQVCAEGGTPSGDGYCIWGQFETTQSHGTIDNEHIWEANDAPSGYGVDH